jgi:hypothetical protein
MCKTIQLTGIHMFIITCLLSRVLKASVLYVVAAAVPGYHSSNNSQRDLSANARGPMYMPQTPSPLTHYRGTIAIFCFNAYFRDTHGINHEIVAFLFPP